MGENTKRSGQKNNNWKGGRVVEPRGYVLIRVGVGHPLADVRGYAYEHRVVAEKKVGRRLKSGEEVHHRKGRSDNGERDLDVKASRLHHSVEHRTSKLPSRAQRMPGEPNTIVECACGCSGSFLKYDKVNRLRRYLPNHNSRRTFHG